MTAKEMIKALQDLGKENLDKELVIREVAIAADPKFWTPYRVKILNSNIFGEQRGNIIIY